ncbi:MAG: hypothetical protein AABX13_01530 [Nanoarchaeota archaeon]
MINKTYRQTSTLEKIRKEFQLPREFPSVLLFHFFDREFYLKLREQVARSYFTKEVERTTHSYALADGPALLTKFFNSQGFLDLLSTISGTLVPKIEQKTETGLYSFSWKDYTILSDTAWEEPGIDIILDFTAAWEERAGGAIVYKDEQGNFISVPIAPNLLAIVERKPGVQRYVQYVNHYAGKKKRYLFVGTVSCTLSNHIPHQQHYRAGN